MTPRPHSRPLTSRLPAQRFRKLTIQTSGLYLSTHWVTSSFRPRTTTRRGSGVVSGQVTPPVSFLEVVRNRQRRTRMQGIRKITKTLWSPGSRPMVLARVGGKIRWMEALVEAEEVGEDFQAWDHQVGGSLRWIHMDLEETSVATADQAAARTSSLGSEAWVRAVGVEEGTLVVEAEGIEVMVGMEVPGGMTIAIATTMGEATTEVGGAVTANVGEEVVEAAVGDTESPSALSLLHLNMAIFAFTRNTRLKQTLRETRIPDPYDKYRILKAPLRNADIIHWKKI